MLLSTSDADSRDVVDINLGGLNVCRVGVFPPRSRLNRSIINTVSVTGTHDDVGQTSYCASRAGATDSPSRSRTKLRRTGSAPTSSAPALSKADMTSAGQRVGPQFIPRRHPAAPMGHRGRRRRGGELARVPQIRVHDRRCLSDRRRPVAAMSPSTLSRNLRCPYAWLVLDALAARYPQLVDALRWRLYRHPDDVSITAPEQACARFAYAQMLRETHLDNLRDVSRLARGPRIDRDQPARPQPPWGGATPCARRRGAEREDASTCVRVECGAVDAWQEHLRSRHCGGDHELAHAEWLNSRNIFGD